MDYSKFMPRCPSERALHLNQNHTGPLPRDRLKPLRTAPPILPPRNPLRSEITPQPLKPLAKTRSPSLQTQIPRQPNIKPTSSLSTTPLQRSASLSTTTSLQRSTSLSTTHPPLLPLPSPIAKPENFSRSLHEEIAKLRQSYIDLQSDDVLSLTPATPPRRSASTASPRTPVRNFSLPTYSDSPTKQGAPLRPLRRVRSRSVNLGVVAEASELPDFPLFMPLRPLRSEGDEMLMTVREIEEILEVARGESGTTEAGEAVMPVKEDFDASLNDSHTNTVAESTATESSQETLKRERTCIHCGSTMKALALNPVCCIERPELGRMCFGCWTDLLAEGVHKQDRKRWLRCLVCGKELGMRDARRLASRGTMIR
jgi:hypothetical protein